MTTVPVYSSERPLFPRRPDTQDNLGPFINVVTWVLLITSALAVLTRIVTKRALGRGTNVDDAFVIAALLTSIGSGISVSLQTANGLGKNIILVTNYEVIAYQKAEYANKLLYIATLAFAKLSIISLLMILTASEVHRNLGIGLTVLIALWGFTSEFVTAFQCGSVEPWIFLDAGARCLDLESFWRAMSIINILSDLALILFPVHVIVTLQMSMSKKITILVFFGARSIDIIATGVQMAYLDGFSSSNPTQALWQWTMTTQIIECVTILTSCVPYLRPLLESLPSGLYGSDELRRRGTPSELGYSRSKSGSYQMSSGHSYTKSPIKREKHIDSQLRSQTSRKSQPESRMKRFLPMLSQERTTHANSASGLPGGPRRPDGQTGVEIVALGRTEGDDKKWDVESTGSNSKILKTTVVSAEWEDVRPTSPDLHADDIEVLK